MSKKSEYLNKIYRHAIALGFPDTVARVAAAQSAVETNYGSAAPGNNYFGITAGKNYKGTSQPLATTEYSAPGVSYGTSRGFRTYKSLDDSLADYGRLIQSSYPQTWNGSSVDEAAAGLMNGTHGAYASYKPKAGEPTYDQIVANVAQKHFGPSGGDALQAIGQAVGQSPDNPYLSAYAGNGQGAVPLPRNRPTSPISSLMQSLNGETGPSSITPQLGNDGSISISGQQPMPTQNAGNAGASSYDSGLGALSDPRTSSLMHQQVPSYDAIGNGPNYGDLNALLGGSGAIQTTGQAGNVAMPPGARPSNIPPTITVMQKVPVPSSVPTGADPIGNGPGSFGDLQAFANSGTPAPTFKYIPVTIPNPAYTPPSAPAEDNPFGGIFGNIGNALNGALGYADNGINAVKTAIPQAMNSASTAIGNTASNLIPSMLQTVQGRSLLINAALGVNRKTTITGQGYKNASDAPSNSPLAGLLRKNGGGLGENALVPTNSRWETSY